MKQIFNLVLLSLSICVGIRAEFNISGEYYIQAYPNITAMSLASAPVDTKQGTKANLVIGTQQGLVVFFYTEDLLSTPKQFHIFPNKNITTIHWDDNGGVFVSTDSQIKLLRSYDGSQLVTIRLLNPPLQITYGFNRARQRAMTAVSYQDHIQIYENEFSILTYPLQRACRAMSFDQTANYFYFFDSNRRYVIDVVNRKVFGTNILTQRYYSVGLCDRYNYLDISATMNQNGMITIWDDYGQLVSYSAGVSVRQNTSNVLFAYYSNYILTYSLPQGYVSLRKTNFTNFTNNWYVYQQFIVQSQGYPVLSIDSKTNLLAALTSNNTILIYKFQYQSSYIGLIIFGSFVAIVIGCIIQGKIRAWWARRKNNLFQESPVKFVAQSPYQNKNTNNLTQSIITSETNNHPINNQVKTGTSENINPYYLRQSEQTQTKYNRLEDNNGGKNKNNGQNYQGY